MGSYSNYAREWTQSLIIASSIAFISVMLFIFGGFDLNTERGRLALFLWAVAVGVISTYLALFKWKRGMTILSMGF
jgi:hypothetical protein